MPTWAVARKAGRVNLGIVPAPGAQIPASGDAASSGPCDDPTRVRSARERIRVVDYACVPAVSAPHSAYSALRGTDALRPRVRRAPQDVGARCSVCRQLIQVLADRAGAAPTSPFPRPHVGFTAARAQRSGLRPVRPSGAGNGPERPKRNDADVEPPLVTAYRQT
jgi:hypothetical protein